VALLVAVPQASYATAAPPVSISSPNEQTLQGLLTVRSDAAGEGPSERSEVLSRQFLGVPYGANTLIGSANTPEQVVVELQKVDCFTYADYVEALKRATTRDEFLDGLIEVRYKGGVVGFETRKHFFTDWSASAPAVATDVTSSMSDKAIQVAKDLNRKDAGGVFLPGLPVVPRTLSYIPRQHIDDGVLGQLRTGDYIGAYAEDGGLDVTHVGILIDAPGGPVFRNASSLPANNKVVDTPLLDYVQSVPGIVVLRPLH